MAKQPAEHVAEESADAPDQSSQAAEKMLKGNAEALTEGGNAASLAIQELTKAYQELATKNARNLTAAMEAPAAVKSPSD